VSTDVVAAGEQAPAVQVPAVPAPTAPAGLPAARATSGLGGVEKAAALLVTLGSEQAGEILKHFSEHEIQAITTEMARLRRVAPDIASSLLEEFNSLNAAAEHMAVGGLDFARAALERSVGKERAAELLDQLAFLGNRPFEFLRRTPPEQIVSFLAEESPQTMALVTASLPSTIAAKVLGALPVETQSDVALRIATMSETSPDVIRELESGLRLKLSNVLGSELTAAGGVESLADILNLAGRSTERNVLDAIAETHAGLAEEIRARLFTFDDIVILSDRDMQILLRDVDQKDLVLALRGVADNVKDTIVRNMSTRGAQMLLEDMEAMTGQPKSLVEEAQSRIVAAVRRLDESGTITLARSEEDEVI
jgi:flagellar motor switch protein FliG